MKTRIITNGSTTLALVGMLGGAMLSAGAQAAAPETTHRVAVRYTEAELAKETQRQALEARVESAAREACGQADIRNLALRRAERECRAIAIARAMAEIEAQRAAALKPVGHPQRAQQRAQIDAADIEIGRQSRRLPPAKGGRSTHAAAVKV